MNKRMIGIIISILVVVVIGVFYLYRASDSSKQVKMGAVMPLTGRFAFMGSPIKNAMDMAVNEINEKGGINGKKMEIIYGDSQGDPKTGVTATQKLIDYDNVKIITSFLTGVSEAIKPVAEEKKILFLAQTVSPTITNNAKNTIRMHYSFAKEGEVLGGHLLAVGKEPIGFIRSKDPSTSFEVEKVIIPLLKEKGLNKIIDETFDVANKDFRSLVLKIKSQNIKQLCILGYGSDFPNILKELNNAGLIGTIDICGNLGFVELPKGTPESLLQKVVFTTPPYLIGSQKTDTIRLFEKHYRSAFKTQEISYSAYYAYDLVYLLKQAMEDTKSENVADIKNNLIKKQHDLMTGAYQYNESGDAHPPIILGTFEGAEIVLYKK